MIIYLLLNVSLFLFASVRCLMIVNFNKTDVVENAISSLAADLSRRYFSHVRCLVFFTDTLLSKTFIPSFKLPDYIPVVQVQSINNDCNNPYLQNIVEFAYSQYCNGFIVQSKQPLCFINTLQNVTQDSIFRLSPRLLFLPSLYNPIISSKLFSSKDLEFIPDVLVVDLHLSEESSPQFQMLTIDWMTGTTTLAECKLQQCLEININLYPDKIKNLKGRNLRLSTIHYPPYSILQPVFDGSDVRIAQEYARIHNCSWKIIQPNDGKRWGYFYENGTATGIYGLIRFKEADVGLGGLYTSVQAHTHLSLTTIYSQPGITCLVPRPKMISNWLLPFIPFSIYTWILLFLTIVFVTVALYLSNKIIYYLEVSNANQVTGNQHGLLTVMNMVMEIFALLFLQPSSHIKWFSTPVRQLCIYLEFMFFFIAAFYLSRIAEILTVPRYHRAIESPRDLAESGIQWGDTDDEFVPDYPITLPWHKKLIKQYQILTTDQLHARSLTGDFGFPIERLPSGYFTVVDYITEESAKQLMLMKEDIFRDLITVALHKGSPLLDSFNNLVHQIFETGLHLHWETEISRNFFQSRLQEIIRYNSFQPTQNSPTILQISHIQGPFFFLCIGLSIAFIVFLVEIYSKRYYTTH